jgi:hypothetical protein
MRKIHDVNNPSDVLKSQPTNSSGSKKRKGSKISFPNKNRKLGLNSDISGGDDLGSILLSSEYNFIMFLSIEQRLHTSFDIFIPIRRSLQIEQIFIDREICSNSN